MRIMINKLLAFAALTRIYMSVMLGVAAACGTHIVGGTSGLTTHFWVLIAQCTIFAAGFTLNDIFDQGRDRLVSCKPLAIGKLSMREAKIVLAALCLIGLASSYHIGFAPLVIAALQLLVVCLYSKLKAWSGAWANFATGGLCASAFIFGISVSFKPSAWVIWIPPLMTLCFVMAREIVKDVMDIEQDARVDLPTIPLKYGINSASTILLIITIIVIAVSVLPMIYGSFGMAYSSLMSFVDLALLTATAVFLRQPSKTMASKYLVMTASLLPVALVAFFQIG